MSSAEDESPTAEVPTIVTTTAEGTETMSSATPPDQVKSMLRAGRKQRRRRAHSHSDREDGSEGDSSSCGGATAVTSSAPVPLAVESLQASGDLGRGTGPSHHRSVSVGAFPSSSDAASETETTASAPSASRRLRRRRRRKKHSGRRLTGSSDEDVLTKQGSEDSLGAESSPSSSSVSRTRSRRRMPGHRRIERRIVHTVDVSQLRHEIVELRAKVGPQGVTILERINECLCDLEAKEPSLFDTSKDVSVNDVYTQEEVIRVQQAIRRWLQRRRNAKAIDAKQCAVWNEFLTSETRSYYVDLMMLVSNYLMPLKSTGIVPEAEVRRIFRNVGDIKDMSKALIGLLRADQGSWIPSSRWGALFLSNVLPGLKSHYVRYVRGFAEAMSTLARLRKKNEALNDFLQERADQGKRGLIRLLAAPINRMATYEWVSHELLTLTPPDRVGFEALTKACEEIVSLNFSLAIHRRNALQMERLGGVISYAAEAADMMSAERSFIREGPVHEVNMGVSTGVDRRTLYLFSDYVAVGATRLNDDKPATFDTMLELASAQIAECPDSAHAKHVFEVKQSGTLVSNKVLRLSCATYEEKKSWMNDINVAINSLTSDNQLDIVAEKRGSKQFGDDELDEVAMAMRDPAAGVAVKKRKKGLKTHSACFVGSDAVDWLMRNYDLPRKAAVELGCRLEQKHYFHAVTYNHAFADKNFLYEFQDVGEGAKVAPVLTDHQLGELVKKMFSPGIGVAVLAKRAGWRKKKNLFSGAAATVWLASNLGVRKTVAIEIGNRMLEKGYFRGVTVPMFVDDDQQFFRIKSSTIDDLGFPTERVLKALRTLREGNVYPGKMEDLDYVIKMLSSGGNLYVSNIMNIMEEADIDENTKKFVLAHARPAPSQAPLTVRGSRSNALTPADRARSLALPSRIGGAVSGAAHVSSGGGKAGSDGSGAGNASMRRSDATAPAGLISEHYSLVNAILPKLCDWNFPVFWLHEESKGRPLFFMGYALLLHHDLIAEFDMNVEKLLNWLTLIDKGYNENTYHNATHAADVTQTLNFFITTGGMEKHLTKADILAGLLAALVHDFDHPGVNNAFMVNSKDKLAVRYNDIAVLENHHVASAFALMEDERNNIFDGFDTALYKEIRETMIQCVLATDFSKHFDILGQFKSRQASGLDADKIEDRRLLVKVALKCADISHTSKERKLHLNWTNRITEEFYAQGDTEKARNLPVSPYTDRETGNLPKSQIGFISFLVLPLYEAWVDMFEESQIALDCLRSNLKHWKAAAEKDPDPPAASSAKGKSDAAAKSGNEDEDDDEDDEGAGDVASEVDDDDDDVVD